MKSFVCFSDAERTWIRSWLSGAVQEWLEENMMTLDDALQAAVEEAGWDFGDAYPNFASGLTFDDELMPHIISQMKEELEDILLGPSQVSQWRSFDLVERALGRVDAAGFGREESEYLVASFEKGGATESDAHAVVRDAERVFEQRFPNFARRVAFSAEVNARLHARVVELRLARAAPRSAA